MILSSLNSPVIFQSLDEIDLEIAAEAKRAGCQFCKNLPLHIANYPRKPRGALVQLPESYLIRFSFCCPKEGCRKRTTPPSVRFLGRKVYLATMVTLLTAISGGATPQARKKLCKEFGVDHKTLKRWHLWWKDLFNQVAFWKILKGFLNQPFHFEDGILELITRFKGPFKDQLIAFLRFISPLINAPYSMEDNRHAEDGN
jgi:hypothetical protein